MGATADPPTGPERAAHERGRQLERVNAFSDGLFTIAATLLVLTLSVPHIPAGRVSEELPHRLATVLTGPVPTYFLSFAVIGLFWVRHHELFGALAESDTRFAALNLAFLSFVALLPFPTELLGSYGDQPSVVTLYAANLLVLAVLLRLLHDDARARGLLRTGTGAREHRGRLRSTVAIAVFALSIPLAWVDTRAATLSWLLVFALPPVLVRRRG